MVKIRSILFLSLFFISNLFAQIGFTIDSSRNKIVIPFEFINNFIILPVEVNGAKLNFLLDSGVEETILFSFEESNEIRLENVEKITFSGLGNSESVEGYKSSNNKMKIGKYLDIDHTIYVVLNQDINISSQIGIPVNGILGYHFFKNYPVMINFDSKKISIFKSIESISKKLQKSFAEIPMTIETNKPYINSKISFKDGEAKIESKMLLDIGNSDALWLFANSENKMIVPSNNFEDYLGKGFSGAIYGKRGRIKSFQIDKFEFKNPIVAFPDASSVNGIILVENRLGSIGSEIMKRFTVVLNYSSEKIYLKKNHFYKTPFNVNMSGIDIQHEGLQWVQESYEDFSSGSKIYLDETGKKSEALLKYKFELKPSYSILSVRKNSPAEIAGLKKGDKILKINKKNGYEYKLHEIFDLLKSEENKKIEFEIERNGKISTFSFYLKNTI